MIGIRAQGVPLIYDGRIFRLDPLSDGSDWQERDLIPPQLSLLDERLHRVNIVIPTMPPRCPQCRKAFGTATYQEDELWMYDALFCTDHSEEVWIDIYPKKSGPTLLRDRSNAFTHNPIERERGRLVAASVPITFVLTPRGLERPTTHLFQLVSLGFSRIMRA